MRCHLKVMRVVFYNHPPPGIDSLSGLTKGPGEEGEQLVSLVWKKENSNTTTLWPCSPIRAKGLRGQEARQGWEESNKLAVLPGDPQTVSADKIYVSQFQVLLWWRGKRLQVILGWWGGVQGLVLHLNHRTVLHVWVVLHLFSLWQL